MYCNIAQSILDYGLKAKSRMEWWQEVNRQVANLGWLQISLILVAIIFIAILIGLSTSYIIMSFAYKRRVTFSYLFHVLFSKKYKLFAAFAFRDLARQFIDTTIASPEAHEPAQGPEQEETKLEIEPDKELEQEEAKLELEPEKFPIPELLVEIEHNLKIVTEFSGDALLPLQSDVWDARRDSPLKLPVNLREQLEQAYFDIHSLSGLTWLSTELSYRTPLIDELYRKKLTSITEKLQWIKQNIK
ncbi:hypothetical protein ACFLUF_01010 [Chloroflexota bacterium]